MTAPTSVLSSSVAGPGHYPYTWWPDVATAIEYGEMSGDRVEWR